MVSETVGGLIQAAAEEATLVDSGNSLSAAEQASAIDRLQRLIDASAIDRALIYGSSYSGLLSLTALQQSYTIGIDPTGANTANFSIARPTKITRANLLLSTTVRRPIHVTEDEKKWAAIRYQQVYGPPKMCYFDRGFTTGFATLWFYLIPDSAYQWEFWSWQQNPVITQTTDTINYPPGYAQYWLNAMARALCPMFGRQCPQIVVENLAMAKEQLMSMNTPSPELRGDPALSHENGGLYNWMDGLSEGYWER